MRRSPILLFLGAVLLLLLVAALGNFPRGYIFSYSDFYQMVNFKGKLDWFVNSYVDAGEGGLNFLYVPFYYGGLGLVQEVIGHDLMPAAYSFVFLLGSFLSFLFAAVFLGIRTNENRTAVICFALLYALNPYTAVRFALPTLYFLPYLFVPVLFATAYAYFMEEGFFNARLLWCAVAMLASTSCWAGPPFFVAYSLLLLAFILLVYLSHRRYGLLTLGGKLASFYFFFVSSFLMCFLTWPALLFNYKSMVQVGKYQVDNLAWMYSQSLPILEVLTFRNGVFGISNTNVWLFSVFLILCLGMFSLVIHGLFSMAEKSQKKLLAVFGLMILLVTFLLNKGRGLPWESPTHALFARNPVLCSLRSFDKILVFLPFFLVMSCCIFYSRAKRPAVPAAMVAAVLLLCFPFISGRFYEKHYAVDAGKDYKTSHYAPLVKIPREYLASANLTNSMAGDFRMLSLPWSLRNPDLKGWIFSEKWKNSGANPLSQYFEHPLMQMNEPSAFSGWNYGSEWNEQTPEESLWFLPLAGMLNARYLIFQKDVASEFVAKAMPKLDLYKKMGWVHSVVSNEYFDLLELGQQHFLPHLYVPERLLFVRRSPEIPSVLNELSDRKKTAVLGTDARVLAGLAPDAGRIVIEYKKISPAKYRVKFHKIRGSFPFVFSEAFYSQWKIYPVPYSSRTSSPLDQYQVFPGNGQFQATRDEVGSFVDRGWISELGHGDVRTRTVLDWTESGEPRYAAERRRFDFISKNVRGTIENDNIEDGHFYDTWARQPIDEEYHRPANGYANAWIMDPSYLKERFPGVLRANADGTFDLEAILEFGPQKSLGMGRAYVICFALFVLGALGASLAMAQRRMSRI